MSTENSAKRKSTWRNFIAFWIFGVCTNFVYIVMLAAAQDILSKDHQSVDNHTDTCQETIVVRECQPHSAGLVLLCNIFPAFIIKISYPAIAWKFSYWQRHCFVCLAQAISLVIVALSDSVTLALGGVMMTAVANGMGESTYLALASHYHKNQILAFASGTGMAGILGAFSYAGLTDARLLALAPSTAMLVMLIIPAIFFLTYFFVLEKAETIKKSSISKSEQPSTITVSAKLDENEVEQIKPRTLEKKIIIAKSLAKYMVPLFFVYFAEYLINQGLLELMVFDCSHGFGTGPRSQYRWYQVLYQVGVFISRSSQKIIQLNMTWIAILPVLQILNLAFFFVNATIEFVPHFALVGLIVLYEGLIGGGSYVNSFSHIHRNVDPAYREFALSICTVADTTGILTAALTAIPLHNAICSWSTIFA